MYLLAIDIGNKEKIHIIERPGVREFLKLMSCYYQIIIFTASKKECNKLKSNMFSC
jgi:TFIIF-interacting CTD phosphatase-like protein